MTGVLKYEYKSVFAAFINGLILEKKSCGFIYDYESYILKKFDEFCIDHRYSEPLITREIAMEWAIQRDTESVNYRNQRVSFLRQLSLYMISIGINSYIPQRNASSATAVPHIPDAGELAELFAAIDNYNSEHKKWRIYAMEYQVLFRLYYCCGLRLAEGCFLKKQDVDLAKGILTVRESKGKKDRLVYMADDMVALCRVYDGEISRHFPNGVWFFPSKKEGKPLNKTSVDGKFKKFWEMTACSTRCEKAPTVHALRHAHVVDRMNQWMLDGVSLDAMMPYLSRHLGHSGINETMYYYHQVSAAFQIVRQKDCLSERIIPEVDKFEG